MTIDTQFYSEKPWRIYPISMYPDFIEEIEAMIKRLARSLPESGYSAPCYANLIPR